MPALSRHDATSPVHPLNGTSPTGSGLDSTGPQHAPSPTQQLRSAVQAGGQEGMLSLERCLAELVASGAITLATARSAANDRTCLERYLEA